MEEDELLDWELVNCSDSESSDSITSELKSGGSSVIDDGMILSDHFSIDNLIKRSVQTTDQIEYGVMDSGESFRVEYGSNSPKPDDVRIDLDVSRLSDGVIRVSDSESMEEDRIKSDIVVELTGGTISHCEDTSKCFPESDDLKVDNGRIAESQSIIQEPIEDSCSDSGGNELVSGDSRVANCEDKIVSTEASEVNGGNIVHVVAVNSTKRCSDEGESREIVRWKMPFVLLKYSVFRIGPVWSISLAAAVMGLVLLGRHRLYNKKKKALRFDLKVTIDDKNASHVMNQAARLNEMFTEIRRVPVIRPALQSPSAWPGLSLR